MADGEAAPEVAPLPGPRAAVLLLVVINYEDLQF